MSSDKTVEMEAPYANGSDVYQCKCAICDQIFEGPKRAVCCPSCETKGGEAKAPEATAVPTEPTPKTESPTEQPPTRAEILAQSAATADTMIEEVKRLMEILKAQPPSEKRDSRIAESERLIRNIEATRAGVVDLRPFLSSQPSKADFGFPARVGVLVAQARHRLKKSKFYFPDPRTVVEAVTVLWGTEEGLDELRLRIAHYLSRMNMAQDGLPVSAACRRIIEAAAIDVRIRDGGKVEPDQSELVNTARTALQAFMTEARLVDKR